MGKYYEVIFETGNHSIAYYEDEDEAKRAIGTHNERAKKGELAQESNPGMGPAERVSKVYIYDKHPIEFNEAQTATAEEITAAVESQMVGDLVSVPEAAAAVRELSSPMVNTEAHESNYKMPSVGELTGWDNAPAS